MFNMSFVERENEILKTIERMVKAGLDFVVVGGYAVSAIARHRFSVDCDIVVSKEGLSEFEKLLETEGYEGHIERTNLHESYGGAFVSFRKEVSDLPVAVDMLVNGLVCRATGAAWSFDYVRRHSIDGSISGLKASVTCRVPEKELLIAFKIHSGRRTDVRDIIMLVENVDSTKVLEHIRRGDIQSLKDQIGNIIAALEDENLRNSLKGVFTLTVDVERQIKNTREFIDTILERL